MDNGNIMLDMLESQVSLYRYSIMRKNFGLDSNQLRNLLRNKINRKFQEVNKKIWSEIMASHLNLLNSTHEC